MKIIKTILIAVSIAGQGLAAETQKNVKTKPEKVIVFQQGAQVFRNSLVNLSPGENKIIFEGLESTVNQKSIQAGGNGTFILTDVEYLYHYPELEKINQNDNKFSKAIKQINDSIRILDFKLEEIYNKRDVLSTEKQVLLNYRLYKGETKKDSLAFLKEGLIYLREKLGNIYNELISCKKEEEKLNAVKMRLNERLQEINSRIGPNENPTGGKPDYRIVITVIAEQAGPANITLNYLVQNAGWTPAYDLRSENADSKIKLTYKAMVHQFTGSDWNNVHLILSTGNPNQNMQVPNLNTWYLEPYHVYQNKRDRKTTYPSGYGAPSSVVRADEVEMDALMQLATKAEAEQSYQYVTMNDLTVQAEFDIKLPYSIPTDNKNHIVAIMQKELETDYLYKAVPKADLNAYLLARVTGWEEMNLLPGTASVFFGGSFVGQTLIDPGTVNDTLELNMGQDKSIVISRKRIKEKTKEKILDNDKLYSVSYEIVVKNGNAKSVDIELMDQIPVSRNKSISISTNELSNGNLDENSGIIKWRSHIRAKDNKKITLAFTVKAPKDTPIAIK